MRAAILPLVSVLVVSAVLSADAPTADESVPLTLDTSILGTSWSEQIDPDKDCRFLTEKDRLVIRLPGKDHDLWPKDKRMNAPRLLQEIKGDFDAQVRVCVEGKVSEKSTAPKRAAYVAAGFLFFPEEKWIVRAEYGQSRQWGGCPVFAALHNLQANGGGGHCYHHSDLKGWPLPDDLKTVWLRLERRGNGIRFFASEDGKTWKLIAPPHGLPMREKVKIGLFAASTSSEPFAPRFDNWKLTPVSAQQKKRD